MFAEVTFCAVKILHLFFNLTHLFSGIRVKQHFLKVATSENDKR